MVEGRPELDAQGWYLGPLPKRTGQPLIGKLDGQFRTTQAAWPSGLCLWVAEVFIAAYQKYSAQGGCNGKRKMDEVEEGGGERVQKKPRVADEEENEVVVDPMAPLVAGGMGLPRSCEWKGEKRPFHDGGGLASPGRWPFGKRYYTETGGWRELRRRVAETVNSWKASERTWWSVWD